MDFASEISRDGYSAPTYYVYRDTQPGELFGSSATLNFFPPQDSDELFEALRAAFPYLKTHSQRVREATVKFMLEEQHILQTSSLLRPNAIVPLGTPSGSSATISVQQPSTNERVWKYSTVDQSGNLTVTTTPPSTNQLSLSVPKDIPPQNEMTGVFSVSSAARPKTNSRRRMTEKEKSEYRERRVIKACEHCAKRKRKCRHTNSAAPGSTRASDTSYTGSIRSTSYSPISSASQSQSPAYSKTGQNTSTLQIEGSESQEQHGSGISHLIVSPETCNDIAPPDIDTWSFDTGSSSFGLAGYDPTEFLHDEDWTNDMLSEDWHQPPNDRIDWSQVSGIPLDQTNSMDRNIFNNFGSQPVHAMNGVSSSSESSATPATQQGRSISLLARSNHPKCFIMDHKVNCHTRRAASTLEVLESMASGLNSRIGVLSFKTGIEKTSHSHSSMSAKGLWSMSREAAMCLMIAVLYQEEGLTSGTLVSASNDSRFELTSRIHRLLASKAIVKELRSDHYDATPVHVCILTPQVRSEMEDKLSFLGQGEVHLHEAVQVSRYSAVDVNGDTNLTEVTATGKGISASSRSLAIFHKLYKRPRSGMQAWAQIFPVKERLLVRIEENEDGTSKFDVVWSKSHDVFKRQLSARLLPPGLLVNLNCPRSIYSRKQNETSQDGEMLPLHVVWASMIIPPYVTTDS